MIDLILVTAFGLASYWSFRLGAKYTTFKNMVVSISESIKSWE